MYVTRMPIQAVCLEYGGYALSKLRVYKCAQNNNNVVNKANFFKNKSDFTWYGCEIKSYDISYFYVISHE